MARARCRARLTAGWLSNRREAAAVTLFSSAIAANVIRRFRSTWRSFSKRMDIMIIMHEPHTEFASSVTLQAETGTQKGKFSATNRFTEQASGYPGWFIGDWVSGCRAGGVTGRRDRHRLKQ